MNSLYIKSIKRLVRVCKNQLTSPFQIKCFTNFTTVFHPFLPIIWNPFPTQSLEISDLPIVGGGRGQWWTTGFWAWGWVVLNCLQNFQQKKIYILWAMCSSLTSTFPSFKPFMGNPAPSLKTQNDGVINSIYINDTALIHWPFMQLSIREGTVLACFLNSFKTFARSYGYGTMLK